MSDWYVSLDLVVVVVQLLVALLLMLVELLMVLLLLVGLVVPSVPDQNIMMKAWFESPFGFHKW